MARKSNEEIRAELDQLNELMRKRQHISDAQLISHDYVGKKLKGRERPEHERNAISKRLMGHDVSDDTKNAISQSLNGVMKNVKKRTTICPHCKLEGAIATMQLYHFDKCETRNVIIGTNIITGKQIKLCGNTEIKKAGFSYGNIVECIKGKRKSHKGYIWNREQKV